VPFAPPKLLILLGSLGSNPTLSASFLLMPIDLGDGLTSIDVHYRAIACFTTLPYGDAAALITSAVQAFRADVKSHQYPRRTRSPTICRKRQKPIWTRYSRTLRRVTHRGKSCPGLERTGMEKAQRRSEALFRPFSVPTGKRQPQSVSFESESPKRVCDGPDNCLQFPSVCAVGRRISHR
jgi:hypothetical protein